MVLTEDDITLKLDTQSASIGVALGEIPLEVTRIFLHPEKANHRIQKRHLQLFYKPDTKSPYREVPEWSFHTGPQGAIEIRLQKELKTTHIKVHCHFNELNVDGEPVDAATFFNTSQDLIQVIYLMPLREESVTVKKRGPAIETVFHGQFSCKENTTHGNKQK